MNNFTFVQTPETMLGDFFRINLPYGIKRNDADEWYAFNREYVPLGFNNRDFRFEELNLPIYTKYKGLTEKKLLEIAWHDTEGVKRDVNGEIDMIWLYNDGTNPMNSPKNQVKAWQEYFEKIKLLSKLQEK